ncbi:BatD family protein [Sulfurovum sp. NBC37-1]|uniref:BatD family protein n=1 Tax=Sulfurovum sp. (strain NBC37-1) TaxID=387093 RepID=UPI0001587AC7|nr:BatD family protein [Sulfurovum sp. NBC37-1]BAF73341.1 conserved hypothetical protein [Sulfurovum sp. NBC37-1]
MKHIPGRAVFLFLSAFVLLHGENFVYDFHISKQNAYEKEPLLLSIDLNQTNEDVVLFFHFGIEKNDAFLVEQIDSTQDNTLHHARIHYRYILYPLRTGDINVSFDLVERVTDEEKVAYSFSGDRDDFKKLETKDRKVDVSPIALHVNALPKSTQLVGDFKLSYDIKKHQAQSYEPIAMKIILEGEGYPPVLERLYPDGDDFTLFTQKPLVQKIPLKDHLKYRVTYIMALSHDKSFDLPPLQLHAFDPRLKKAYQLTIPKQHFDITPAEVKDLVDKTDNPQPLHFDFSWLGSLLGYIVVFFAGYMTAISLKWKRKVTAEKIDPLIGKVEACKDEKALMQLLMAVDSKRFEKAINALEKSLYGKGKTNFKQIKQEVLESMK